MPSRVHLNAALERSGDLRFLRSPRIGLKRLTCRPGITSASAERLAHQLNLYRLFHSKMARGQRAKVTGATFLSYRDIDWARSRAVAAGYLGQIFLNVRGRRPQGTVPPERVGAERERIDRVLASPRDPRTGESVVERVLTADEVYRGVELAHVPDLLIEWRPGYTGDSGFSGGGRTVTRCPPNFSSDHASYSVVLAGGAGVRPGRIQAELQDVAPTVLHALGVSVPPEMEGAILPLWDRP